jgi:hypothetical protein
MVSITVSAVSQSVRPLESGERSPPMILRSAISELDCLICASPRPGGGGGDWRFGEELLDGEQSGVAMSLVDARARGDVGEVRRLLDEGANIEARQGFANDTALTAAAWNGHRDVVDVVSNGTCSGNRRKKWSS